MRPSKEGTDAMLAEMLMTYMQIAYDEWREFAYHKQIKGKINYERLMPLEMMNKINKNIKNQMRNRHADGVRAFDSLMEMMAENADEVEEVLEVVKNRITTAIVQCMPYQWVEPMVHSSIAYVMLFYANNCAKCMGNDKTRGSKDIEDIINIIDTIPGKLKIEQFQDLGGRVKPEDFEELISAIVKKVERDLQ